MAAKIASTASTAKSMKYIPSVIGEQIASLAGAGSFAKLARAGKEESKTFARSLALQTAVERKQAEEWNALLERSFPLTGHNIPPYYKPGRSKNADEYRKLLDSLITAPTCSAAAARDLIKKTLEFDDDVSAIELYKTLTKRKCLEDEAYIAYLIIGHLLSSWELLQDESRAWFIEMTSNPVFVMAMSRAAHERGENINDWLIRLIKHPGWYDAPDVRKALLTTFLTHLTNAGIGLHDYEIISEAIDKSMTGVRVLPSLLALARTGYLDGPVITYWLKKAIAENDAKNPEHPVLYFWIDRHNADIMNALLGWENVHYYKNLKRDENLLSTVRYILDRILRQKPGTRINGPAPTTYDENERYWNLTATIMNDFLVEADRLAEEELESKAEAAREEKKKVERHSEYNARTVLLDLVVNLAGVPLADAVRMSPEELGVIITKIIITPHAAS